MNPLAYEGEWGFNIQINTDFDMTGYTPTFMFFLPDGTRVSKSVSAVSSLANGDLEYLVEEDFLVAGKWRVQIWLTKSGTVLKSRVPSSFTIGPESAATP